MKTEAYPSEEVGDDALVGFGGRNNLPLSRKPVKDFGGQILGLPKLLDILLCDGGGHPPALKAGSGHGRKFGAFWLKPWVLELEVGEGED